MTGITPEAFIMGMSALAAGLAMVAMAGVGIGIGFNAGKTVESTARQPEAQGTLLKVMLVGGTYGNRRNFALFISIILLFANPYAQ
jgi:F-type H+-transporting ATPase subunit c